MIYIKLMPTHSLIYESRNLRELSVACECGYDITVISSDSPDTFRQCYPNYRHIPDRVTKLDYSIPRLKRYAIIIREMLSLSKRVRQLRADILSCHDLTWAQDGGALMNQCIHYTDLLQWFVGCSAVEVFAYTENQTHPYTEAEDLGLALVKFENGAYGMIEGTVNIYPKNLSDSLALFGETGTISLTGKTLDDVQAWSFLSGPQSRDEALNGFEIYDKGSGHVPLYTDVVEAIENHRPPLCSADEGRKALELILAIYKSAAEGRPVKLPLEDCATTDFIGRFH